MCFLSFPDLLQAMGYEVTPSSGDTKASGGSGPATSSAEGSTKGASPTNNPLAKGRKVQFAESTDDQIVTDSTPVVSANGDTTTSGARQLVPGITLPEGKKKAKGAKKDKVVEKSTATSEKESKGPSSDAPKTESSSDGARPKDQLIYLSKIIGFKVRNF